MLVRSSERVDLLVIGAGAAGMAAALTAAANGLSVLVCEKSDYVGGTTATSAGTIWIPGSTHSVRAGVPDTVERARAYLDSVIGKGGDPNLRHLREAFLVGAAPAIDALESYGDLAFAAALAHPDYLSNHLGAAFGGRALNTLPFDGRLLGDDFARVRPPRPELTVLGGMMVSKTDIPALLKPFASLPHLRHVASLLARHGWDRIRHRRGTRLVMGNALVARLLSSLRRHDVPVRFGTTLAELTIREGRVMGAVLEDAEGQQTIEASCGVVLATGGVGWNTTLRQRLFPPDVKAHSLTPQDTTGDGMLAAEQAGAVLTAGPGTGALWMPVSARQTKDGQIALFPHIILDRAKPGLLAVNHTGRRFTNEADSYHAFVEAMLAAGCTPDRPAYLVCDRAFIRDYGLGFIHPGTKRIGRHLRSGYLIEGTDAADLAVRIGVEPAAFSQTIAVYNGDASSASGVDEAFGRGGSDLNRFNGDPANLPNPCMRALSAGPLYAVAVWPADLASSSGLRIDTDARVLRSDGAAITGLYACGNDAASIFEGTYPGPGTTLGPALFFAWRAALHAVGHS